MTLSYQGSYRDIDQLGASINDIFTNQRSGSYLDKCQRLRPDLLIHTQGYEPGAPLKCVHQKKFILFIFKNYTGIISFILLSSCLNLSRFFFTVNIALTSILVVVLIVGFSFEQSLYVFKTGRKLTCTGRDWK